MRVAATLIAAVTVQQLVHGLDGDASGRLLQPIPLMHAVCAELKDWAARQKNPHPPGLLAYAAGVCARRSGGTGYSGKPGPTVMLAGWLTFRAA